MKQAVIYARYSPGGNQTYQSIEGQITECQKFARENDLYIVQTYEDEHVTGRNDRRPAFQQLLKDSATAKWEIVLVYAIDRFGRNSIEIAMNKFHLQKNGKVVISATQRTARNIDGSKNMDGILLENIYIGMAEYYSEELSQKITRGLRESYAKGNYTGGVPLLGYKAILDPRSSGERKPRKILAIDETTAPLVRYIFTEYAKGVPKKEIMNELTKRGYKNSKNKPLSISSFQHHLSNRRYIGEVVHDGIVYTNIYPQLIDIETFNKVQIQLAKHKHSPATQKAREPYLLQGKAYCGHCGVRMVGVSSTSKTGAKHYYYACGTAYKKHTCDKKTEQKDMLEMLVAEIALAYLLSNDKIELIADKIIQQYNSEFDKDKIKQFEKRITQAENEIDKLVSAFIESDSLVRAKLNERITNLELQKCELIREKESLELISRAPLTKEQLVSWLKTFENGNTLDKKFQKRIIDLLINSIYIYDDKFIVYFNTGANQTVTYTEATEDIHNNNCNNSNKNTKSRVRISTSMLHQD